MVTRDTLMSDSNMMFSICSPTVYPLTSSSRKSCYFAHLHGDPVEVAVQSSSTSSGDSEGKSTVIMQTRDLCITDEHSLEKRLWNRTHQKTENNNKEAGTWDSNCKTITREAENGAKKVCLSRLSCNYTLGLLCKKLWGKEKSCLFSR